MRLVFLALFALVGFSTTTAVQASPFQNGSFESSDGGFVDSGIHYMTLYAHDYSAMACPGWVVASGRSDWISDVYRYPDLGCDQNPVVDGHLAMQLVPARYGAGVPSFQQTFDTVAGAAYRVSFYAGPLVDEPNPFVLFVDFDNGSGTQTRSYIFDAGGLLAHAYSLLTADFGTAPGTSSSTIRFRSEGTFFGVVIDRVSVLALSDPRRLVALSNRAAHDPLAPMSAGLFKCKLYGKVTTVSDSSFLLDDGSGMPVAVNCTGYSGIADGDIATAIGTLSASSGSVSLTCTAPDVVKIR